MYICFFGTVNGVLYPLVQIGNTIHIKTLEAIVAHKDALLNKQRIIKERLKTAEFMAHKDSCPNCKATFDARMEQLDYVKAGEMTQDFLANILTTNLNQKYTQ